MSLNFDLWLEFEELDSNDWNQKEDICNIAIKLPDGRSYGINVWTFNFLSSIQKVNEKKGENLNGTYKCPPDLLVNELTRDCIEKVITDLLQKGELEDLLNPSVLSKPISRR